MSILIMCKKNCGDPIKFNKCKKIFYEIGLIAIPEVSPPFDEEQQYGRPYQPKHSPSDIEVMH